MQQDKRPMISTNKTDHKTILKNLSERERDKPILTLGLTGGSQGGLTIPMTYHT